MAAGCGCSRHEFASNQHLRRAGVQQTTRSLRKPSPASLRQAVRQACFENIISVGGKIWQVSFHALTLGHSFLYQFAGRLEHLPSANMSHIRIRGKAIKHVSPLDTHCAMRSSMGASRLQPCPRQQTEALLSPIGKPNVGPVAFGRKTARCSAKGKRV